MISKPFLTADWRNLVIISYPVSPDVLHPYLPFELQLDTRDDQAFVSLVGFQFRNTKVKGISWPGFRHFPELNLRFYVRRGERRGVMFVREYVPSRTVTCIARWMYNEPYASATMSERVTYEDRQVTARYGMTVGGEESFIEATGTGPPEIPDESSEAHWFKEHDVGYGLDRTARLLTYSVEHPRWRVYDVSSHRVELDWKRVYGERWGVMQDAKPASVVLAEGSGVSVWGHS